MCKSTTMVAANTAGTFLAAVIESDATDRPTVKLLLRNSDLPLGKPLAGTELRRRIIETVSRAWSGPDSTFKGGFDDDLTVHIYNPHSQGYDPLNIYEENVVAAYGKRMRIRLSWESESSTRPLALLAGRLYDFDGTFQVDGKCLRICEQSNQPNAGTGANVWDGAVLLSQYLTMSRFIVAGKSVLELGAGCGLVGLVASVLGAQLVLLTDLASILPMTRYNVQQNAHHLMDHQKIRCAECDWCCPPVHLLAQPADVILVADCVWVEELVEPLMQTIGTYSDLRTEVLISYQQRGRSTNQAFWSSLHRRFRSVQELHPDKLYKPDVLHLIRCQL